MIAIEQSQDNSRMISEQYNLAPLWGKLVALYENKEADSKHEKELEKQTNLYTLFEAEFEDRFLQWRQKCYLRG